MHIAIALLQLGYRVGTIDLDARQGTLTRYLSNRFSTITKTRHNLPSPDHMAIDRSRKESEQDKRLEDSSFLEMAHGELAQIADYIVIDTPGSDTYLNRLAHNMADTLITPMNDSFIDLDVLAHLDPEGQNITVPSFYANMVMDIQSRRRREGRAEIDWIVMRNRLSPLDAHNKRQIAQALDELKDRLGFRLAPGFGERVIFRELFLRGLTLMDLKLPGSQSLSMSEITARQEVRNLVYMIAPQAVQKSGVNRDKFMVQG